MIVIAVVAILSAIAIPLINSWLQQYRLDIAAQQIADGLQTAKMQAVAKTRRRELLFDVPGNRAGLDGAELINLPSGVRFDTGGVSASPEPGVGTSEPVTFPATEGNASLRAAGFTGRGLPDIDPGTTNAVYLTNTSGTRVVLMTSAGNIKTREWTGEAWR